MRRWIRRADTRRPHYCKELLKMQKWLMKPITFNPGHAYTCMLTHVELIPYATAGDFVIHLENGTSPSSIACSCHSETHSTQIVVAYLAVLLYLHEDRAVLVIGQPPLSKMIVRQGERPALRSNGFHGTAITIDI